MTYDRISRSPETVFRGTGRKHTLSIELADPNPRLTEVRRAPCAGLRYARGDFCIRWLVLLARTIGRWLGCARLTGRRQLSVRSRSCRTMPRSTVAQVLGVASLLVHSGLSCGSIAQAGDPVAVVAALQGRAIVVQRGSETAKPLSVNAPIFQQDIVQTAAESRIKLVFVDDTVLTLGEQSTLKVTEYVYSPERSERSSLLTLSEGIFRAIVRKLLPGSKFEVRTMTTVAAVRGTDWMGEATQNVTAMVVLEGAVAISSANPEVEGEVVLRQGDGISIRLDEAPAFKKKWSQIRIRSFKNRTSVE